MTTMGYFVSFFLLLAINVSISGAGLSLGLNIGNLINLNVSALLEQSFPGEFTGSPDTSLSVQDNQVKFFLYTVSINGTQVTRNNSNNLDSCKNRRIVFVVHGWRDDSNDLMPQSVKDAYLASRRNICVIIVDWNEISRKNYVTAAYLTSQVGAKIAEFVDTSIENVGISLDNISFVGHSLGAHVSGFAGKLLENQLRSITGLDPAGPLFTLKPENERLSSNDAKFVQIIHTNIYILGYPFSLGDADYFPNNGGPIQPGCDILGRCSHDLSFKFYAESLRQGGFRSVQCSLGLCNSAKTAYMGNDVVDESLGDYYLTTNSQPPYSRT